MTKNVFEARRKQLEEEYFRKKDAQLVDKLKSVFHRKIDREAIQEATGITNEGLLDNLVALNLSGESMAAFQLYPLVEIAWADGEVDEREIHAVLSAAERHGVGRGSAAFALLENALKNRPRDDSRKAWYLYAEELRKVLSAQELESFRNDLLDDARHVAEASGGILNLMFTVSGNEQKVLDAIKRALTHE
ncbi:MAG TPA: hypothetical protein VMW17_11905 [Candidatus Binatia bacterium]|nr:hypothetical protein [Candidatus Binatia bacterium]